MLKIPAKYLKPLDYLFIFRPTLFFPIWIITLAGYSAFFLYNEGLKWWSLEINWIIVANFVLITLAAGGTFILNQIKDVDTDKDNKKLFLISEDHIHPEIAKKIASISIGFSLLILLPQNVYLFLLLALFVLFWGYLYNYKPFVWKDSPIMGICVNMIGGLVLFFIGWIMAGKVEGKVIIYVIPYLFAWGSVALLTTIPDMEGDSLHNKNTFAVLFGKKTTIWVAFIFLIIGFTVGMINKDPVISHPILLSIILYIIMLFKQTDQWVFRCIRYPMLFIALFLCVEFPLFFIVLLVNYYLSKIYYVSRFDLDYPTFNVEEQN